MTGLSGNDCFVCFARTTACRAVAYEAVWNEERSLLASCAHDGTGITWSYDPDRPLEFPEMSTAAVAAGGFAPP